MSEVSDSDCALLFEVREEWSTVFDEEVEDAYERSELAMYQVHERRELTYRADQAS